ncbi:MAG: hypothetical protein V1854_04830 [Methanobacteriota archaeon]
MKISIKEIKVEHDGSELLYVRDIGFIVKSETFSGAVKDCQKRLKEEQERKTEKKETSQTVPIEQLIPVLLPMFSQWLIKSKEDEGDKSEPGNIEEVEKPLEELKKEPGG